MNYLILLAAALLPVAILLIYAYRKDPRPEPASLLAKSLAYGVLICFPIVAVEFGVSHIVNTLITDTASLEYVLADAFLVAAIPEECFKLLALWMILRHNSYFDEHYDGIMYAVCVGLGFAALENILYVSSNPDNWHTVAISRALLSVPGHYAFAVLMGYFYSIHRFVRRSLRGRADILLVPVIAHGCYDTLAFAANIDPEVSIICFIVLILLCIKMHKACRIKITELINRDTKNSAS